MHTNIRLYEQTQHKKRRAKQIERERSNKNHHGKDGSKHQRNKMLAELRESEAMGE